MLLGAITLALGALSCTANANLAVSKSVATGSCSQLAQQVLTDTTITSAEAIAAGEYALPESERGFAAQPGMNLSGKLSTGPNPAFCRITATLKPTLESNIRIEVWLPLSKWNGKLLGVGNFGWGGAVTHPGMLTGLIGGYATASTDTGHDSAVDGAGGKFALGHPEKLIDYAYRASHLMTVHAKTLVKAFYGREASQSYWIGCSLGGLEGLIEARRYPADYDGIVVGAPPNPLVRFNALQLWPSWLISQDSNRLIPKEKYTMIHNAVVRQCASPIGRMDNLVDEPDRCRFDPQLLECKGGDAPDCLTAPQVYLLQHTYAGPRNPRTGELIFPGPARGTELDMFTFANGQPFHNALDLFRYVVFEDEAWDAKNIDWDEDVSKAIAKAGALMHVDADLKPFFDRGGKLLLYIGWTDYHNPEELIEYYKSLVRKAGADKTRQSLRLFTIPGMGHCGGGNGCDTFDKLGTLDAWVASGKTPERVVATKSADGKVVRSRPLCAWPKVAIYKSAGDPADAANFDCLVH